MTDMGNARDATAGSRPSPFAAQDDGAAPQRAAALDDTGRLAATDSKVAWQEAWEEASEAPLIAAALSGTVSFAHCYVNEAEEAQSVKAAEAAPSTTGAWRGEVARLLQLAVPIAVSCCTHHNLTHMQDNSYPPASCPLPHSAAATALTPLPPWLSIPPFNPTTPTHPSSRTCWATW
jgi:hypothetical protein